MIISIIIIRQINTTISTKLSWMLNPKKIKYNNTIWNETIGINNNTFEYYMRVTYIIVC